MDYVVQSEQEEKQLNLPLVPSGRRFMPNDLIRSNLFTIGNHRMPREFLKDKKLYSLANVSITYRGEELRQDDEDVWMLIIALCSEENSDHIQILPFSFIKMLGWPARAHYKEKLKECISRMSATDVKIYNRNTGCGISFSFVRKFMWHDENGKSLKSWQIWVERGVGELFGKNQFTKLYWDQRKKLKPLAKWLYAYYSSHAEPIPIPVEVLRKACGSKSKQFKHFKEALRGALVSLVQVGFLEDFFIDAKNRVFVGRAQPKYKYVKHHGK